MIELLKVQNLIPSYTDLAAALTTQTCLSRRKPTTTIKKDIPSVFFALGLLNNLLSIPKT